jgi:hypothetical protein
MLTLTNALNIEGYTLFRDDTNGLTKTPPSGGEPQNFKFYVLPEAPGIALDGKGNPIFSLIVYRHDETRIAPEDSTKDAGGGILTFTVELGVPDGKMKAIQSKLRTRIFGEGASADQDVDLSLVPFLDGTVSVAVAGETTGDSGSEFVKGAVGTGKVSGIGNNRKAVMVKLTQAGASLMAQLEKLRTLPINVQYDLTFEHRLLGVTMHVWMDINSSYTLMQEVTHQTGDYDDGYLGASENHVSIDKITSVTETLVRNKTAGVQVTPETSEVEPDTLASLEKFGFDMLNKEMEKAIEATPPPKELDRTYLTKYDSTIGNNFNFTLDRKMVLVRNFRPSANVSNVFQEGKFADLVAFVDLRSDFFSFLKVPVRVNADFTTLPLDSVVVTVTYKRERFGGGGREQVRDSFEFTDGSKIETFLAYANTLEEVTYDWDAVVHYKGITETFQVGERGFNEDFLVVDVGKLGMIQVDLGLGLVDLTNYPAAKVTFRYNSAALGRTLERDFKLDKTQENAMWVEAVHEEPTKGWQYKVDWLTKSGEILPGAWTASSSTRLRLDAPVADQMKVSVMCSGNFKDSGSEQISQVGVSLVYKDPDNHYTQEGQLTFTQDGQMQPWEVELRNPDLRAYQYRYTIVYKDGLVKEVPSDGSWLDGEPGFITVGEHYLVRVDVFPALLTFADNAKMVEVDFDYSDAANNIEEHDSLVFSSNESGKKTWRVRGAPGGPKKYSYQIKYFSVSGAVTALPVVTQDAEVIVIPPLAPPPVVPPA